MQVFISSGQPDLGCFEGLGYRPLLWYGGNVYVGNDTQTHDLLSKEFELEFDNWDNKHHVGYFTEDLGIEWLDLPGGRKVFEPAPGVNDAILEALGGTNTFMSKRLGSGYEFEQSDSPEKYDYLVNAAKANGYEVTFNKSDDGRALLDFERDGEIMYLQFVLGRPTQARIYSRLEGWDVRASLAEIERRVNSPGDKTSGWNDVMQWSGDALDWVSEKGLDADAAMHSRIHPEGCDDNECWVCNEGQRPKRFETPDVE